MQDACTAVRTCVLKRSHILVLGPFLLSFITKHAQRNIDEITEKNQFYPLQLHLNFSKSANKNL